MGIFNYLMNKRLKQYITKTQNAVITYITGLIHSFSDKTTFDKNLELVTNFQDAWAAYQSLEPRYRNANCKLAE